MLFALIGHVKTTRFTGGYYFKKYAKSIGVDFNDDIRLIGRNIDFGSEPYLIQIGKHVTISSDVSFITHDGGTYVFRDKKEAYKNIVKYGKIVIKDNVFIGQKSIILPNVVIGSNVVVGAGSIITKSIPDNCVVAGNPARFICTYNNYVQKSINYSPNYNIENYKKNKKDEVLKITQKTQMKEYIKT